jgi:penicillin-binding protein 2
VLPSKPLRERRHERYRLLVALTLAGFGLTVLGLARLQIVDGMRYAGLAKENRVRPEVLRAPRGTIYDRNGELLADSAPSFGIVFRPFPAESTQRALETMSPAWLARISALVELDSAEVRRRVNFANLSGQSAMLMHDAPFAILARVEETRGELPGIEVQVEPLRRYPHGTLAAHLLGYAGEINSAELDTLKDAGYQTGDLIGRTGVERSYEEILRGRDGVEYVVVNARGRRVSTLKESGALAPLPGQDLVLTLDLKVQRALEEAMADVPRGAAVVLDPRDGGILAMVSRPVYDPNEFSHGLTRARWKELSEGGANPLLDRAIQGVYPPGSTFKIVTMAAALARGVARADTRLAPCAGGLFYGGRRFGCWQHRGHGSLDLIEALQHSCDVYFYQLGLRLGLGGLEETAKALGLGARTGVDLPQEARGLIPSAAYYDKRWGARGWRSGLLLNLAIGQGELLLTPLQLALLTAEAASDGRPLRPHVVERVAGARAFRPARPVQPGLPAGPAVWGPVQEAMERVVAAGTGAAARVPGLRVAGKTGTAQNPHGQDHALFVCYAPVDSARVAVAIVIENAGHGGSVCAPRAGEMLRRLFLPDSLQRPAAPLAARTPAGPAVRDSGVVDGD